MDYGEGSAIDVCLRAVDRAANWRREKLERALKEESPKVFVREAIRSMNSPIISPADSLWHAICERKLHKLNLDRHSADQEQYFNVHEVLSLECICARMGFVDATSEVFLFEVLASNTIATPSAKLYLRDIAAELKLYKKEHDYKRCWEMDGYERILARLACAVVSLLVESPEFSRLLSYISSNKHLLPEMKD